MSAPGSQAAAGGEPADSRHPDHDRDSDAAGGDLRSAAELELELAEVHCLTTGCPCGRHG